MPDGQSIGLDQYSIDPGYHHDFNICWILKNTKIIYNEVNKPQTYSNFNKIYEVYKKAYYDTIHEFYCLENRVIMTTDQEAKESHDSKYKRLGTRPCKDFFEEEIHKSVANCMSYEWFSKLLHDVYLGLRGVRINSGTTYLNLITTGGKYNIFLFWLVYTIIRIKKCAYLLKKTKTSKLLFKFLYK